MNELPERHRPVPRHMPPIESRETHPLLRFCDHAVERVVRVLDAVIDRAMGPLLIGLLVAVVVGVVLAVLGVFADHGPACVTQYTGAGQAVCVKQ